MKHQFQNAHHLIRHFLKDSGGCTRRSFLAKLSRSAVAVAAAHERALSQGSTKPGTGRLLLRIFDASTAEAIPARLHVELPGGSHWTPVGKVPGHGHAADGPGDGLLVGRDFKEMLAPARCSLDWTHLSRGEAQLELPVGRSRLYVSRGFEYRPIQFDVDVRVGSTVEVERPLERWIDMPGNGYFCGDIHQHFSRSSPRDNALWEALARAEDLHLINTMVLRHGEPFLRYDQYAYGDEGTHQSGHYVIAPGEEFRDNDLSGHVTMAGIEKVIEPVSTGPQLGLGESFPPFGVACGEVKSQGGIVGWAHGGLAGVTAKTLHDLTPRGMESVSVEGALGLIDFIEVVQFAKFLGEPFWYRLLGAGVRLAGVGGTDFPFGIWLAPWYPTFGQERTYVRMEGALTAAGWFEGIRKGRVFLIERSDDLAQRRRPGGRWKLAVVIKPECPG